MTSIYEQFVASIESGDLDTSKKLYKEHAILLTSGFMYKSGQLFRSVCVKGNLEGAKWLYGLDDVGYENALSAFQESILNKKFNIGKWISETIGKCINSSAIIYIFGIACLRCQQDIIDYLMQNHPNIDYSYQLNMSLELYIQYENIEVLQFVITTYNQFINKSMIIYYSQHRLTSPEIKQILNKQINWINKMYPLWLASNESPCKGNLFYKIPEDVSRYIISNYL
jgi:hypothetical protein